MIIIGEKINGSIPSMAKAIAEKNADYIRNLAKKQADAGANFIDVCASVSPDTELETLKWLIGLVQEVTDTPVSIDSPNAKVFAEAIQICKKPGLINSVSMEGNKIEQVFPLIAGTEWECVTLLCDDTGIPKSAEKRLEVFDAIIEKAEAGRISLSRLHVDPVVEMLCASEDGIAKILKTIKTVKERCPDVHVTGGASNISFNLPLRKFINRSFIILCMGAGMDSAIIDPLNQDMLGLIYAAEALLGKDEMCMDYIGAYREGLFGEVKG
ncbi:MAG: methyltetrahydrofolate cobalamin methyltransferase [Spirochaetaceae bacterium]|jgi:5-methyltetrahydrofolate--homocysteine methyltransferase|nr:methyltetrahydrofolate cobalamin methyltransferase [Spirochaetaceae bacterium]